MGVLLTTSKSAGKGAKALCRSLAAILPGGVCESRGSKGVGAVIARARLMGKQRVAFIHGEHEEASSMQFARVRASSWEWLEPEVRIKTVRIHPPPGEQPCGLSLTGVRAGEWRELLCAGGCGCGAEEAAASCLKGKLKFSIGKKITGPELVLE